MQTKFSDFTNVFLPKYAVWTIWIVAILSIFNFFRGCSTNKEDIANRKAVEAMTNEIDSLKKISVTKEEIEILFQIEGLKISKRMLYDNNAVIRTAIRPDDRMNDYDKEIENLQKKLKSVK
jgi:hypothetical protein